MPCRRMSQTIQMCRCNEFIDELSFGSRTPELLEKPSKNCHKNGPIFDRDPSVLFIDRHPIVISINVSKESKRSANYRFLQRIYFPRTPNIQDVCNGRVYVQRKLEINIILWYSIQILTKPLYKLFAVFLHFGRLEILV